MLLSDPSSSSSTATTSKPTTSTDPFASSNGNSQFSTNFSRELAVAAVLANTDSVPDYRHPPTSSPSISIYQNQTVNSSNLRIPNQSTNGFVLNGHQLGKEQDLSVPKQRILAVDSISLGAPLSPTTSLSESNSSTYKTPMEMLAESMKGRMLFAIPKKGQSLCQER